MLEAGAYVCDTSTEWLVRHRCQSDRLLHFAKFSRIVTSPGKATNLQFCCSLPFSYFSLLRSCQERLLCLSLHTMYRHLFRFSLSWLTLLKPVNLTPIQVRQAEHISTARVLDLRSASDSCATDQPSIYICQNE